MSHDDWALTLTGLAALATTILAVLGLMNSRQLSHVIRLARRELAFSRRPVVCVQTGEPDVEHGSLRLPATFRETSGHPARLHQLNVRVEAPEIEPPEIGPQELTVSHVRHDLLYELTEEVDRRLDEVRRHDLWVRVPRRLLNGHDAVDGGVPFAVELCEWQTPCFLRQCYATSATTSSGGASASRAPTRYLRSR